ncbi:hypothetical protein DB346_21650 [Verrucomicrobia bacterium LW23]|nr:hypothetical protein DB346_21650 [Verrucomicrobia bacterium LW23]
MHYDHASTASLSRVVTEGVTAIFPRWLRACALALSLVALSPGVCAAETPAPAAETKTESTPATTKKKLTKNSQPFDKDGDGELNAEETKAYEDSKKAAQEKRKADELAKYDTNKDGKINKDERAKIMADKEAEKAKADADKAKEKADKAKEKAEKKLKEAKDAGKSTTTPAADSSKP